MAAAEPGLAALQVHCAAFGGLIDRKLPDAKWQELSEAMAAYYHAGAFGGELHKAKMSGGRGGGGGGGGGYGRLRFTQVEVGYLREAHRLFAKSEGANWVVRALKRFPFHPERTAQSLKAKWYQMHK